MLLLRDVIVAVDGRDLVACVGLEARGPDGLLRSFAVEERRRGVGLGRELYRRILAHAALYSEGAR